MYFSHTKGQRTMFFHKDYSSIIWSERTRCIVSDVVIEKWINYQEPNAVFACCLRVCFILPLGLSSVKRKPRLSSLQLLFAFIFIWKERRKEMTFTGICAIFDPDCHVVDQTVYCMNKWPVVWKQQNHQCLPLRYV